MGIEGEFWGCVETAVFCAELWVFDVEAVAEGEAVVRAG